MDWNELVDKLKALGGEGLIAALVVFVLGLLARDIIPKLVEALVRFVKWLWAIVRGRGADRAFEEKYLSWLVGQHHHLGLLPAQVVARRWGERQQFVELEDVYVQLSVSSKSGDGHWASTYGEGKSHWRKRPWFGLRLIRFVAQLLMSLRPFEWLERLEVLTQPSLEPGNVGLVVDKHRRLIIRGDPGSGKTTLLRYLAVTCARALRNDRGDGDSSSLVKKRLLWDERPFPIMVTLSRHGDVESWGGERSLTDVFLEEMPPELRRECPPEFFERRLRDGDCLIMLDAFDELGSPETRGAMAQRIAGFLEVYDRLDNHLVITTRVVGYEGQLDRYGFEIRTVQDLNAGQIRALIKHRYAAIRLAETAGRQVQESEAIAERLRRRSELLIEKIESRPRLRQLATNPMLLSLIVLVHFLKVELPEERVLLYRDCVEILTERWQKAKREQMGIHHATSRQLTLSQKLVLLREIAFAIQQRRQETSSQALIPRNAVVEVIAEKLPDFLGTTLSESEGVEQEVYLSQAEKWVDSIQVESGILVERGLDNTGEPLIGFSHLTFQEYLTAVAICEVEAYQSSLWSNLLNPAWREVVLLHVGLISDPTLIIRSLIESHSQPEGTLLAGYCLAEPLKRVEPEIQHAAIEELKIIFSATDESETDDSAEVLQAIGTTDAVDFLIDQASLSTPAKQLSAIRALGQVREDNPEIGRIGACLVGLLESESEPEVTIAARESLAQVGDPRFVGPELQVVQIPKHLLGDITSSETLRELIPSQLWARASSLKERLALVGRAIDYSLFLLKLAISQRRVRVYLDEFEISEYPVTNLEYNRFIEATGHEPPRSWTEGMFPAEEATHPVTGIATHDAKAFCKWITRRTGNTYRLPREWEWEIAARGKEKRLYPWGNQFDKNLCNSKESGIGRTTPVGSYWKGNSPYGVSDMSGNVWEITKGFQLLTPLGLLVAFMALDLTFLLVYSFSTLSLWFIPALLLIYFVLRPMSSLMVFRGGSWQDQSERCTCFYRQPYDKYFPHRLRGFRCVREP